MKTLYSEFFETLHIADQLLLLKLAHQSIIDEIADGFMRINKLIDVTDKELDDLTDKINEQVYPGEEL